jgi:hypothetical protein
MPLLLLGFLRIPCCCLSWAPTSGAFDSLGAIPPALFDLSWFLAAHLLVIV